MKVINTSDLPALKSSNKGRPQDVKAAALKSEIVSALEGGAEVVALTPRDLAPIGADGNTVESQLGTLKRAFKRDGFAVRFDAELDGENVYVRRK